MQSAGCGIGYKITHSRSGTSNFLCFSRVFGWELMIKIVKDFVGLLLCVILPFCEQESGPHFVVLRCSYLEVAGLLVFPAFCRSHLPFRFSVGVAFSLLPSPTPKQVIYQIYSYNLERTIFSFFHLDVGIPLVWLPPRPTWPQLVLGTQGGLCSGALQMSCWCCIKSTWA